MFKRKENSNKTADQEPLETLTRLPDAGTVLTEKIEFRESVSAPVVTVSDTTTIPETCYFSGEISAAGDVHINGTVKGKIRSEKTVFVLQKGKVEGEISADKIEINGSLTGLCRSREVAINANGFMDGTIECEALSINKKGRFYGTSKPFTAVTTNTEQPFSTKSYSEIFSAVTPGLLEEQALP